MALLILLLAQTVPVEYPYLEIAKRELAFIPPPEGIDTATYERTIDLHYAEDSLNVALAGTLKERWLGAQDPLAVQKVLMCDSVRRRGDTLVAWSGLRFEFTKSGARIRSLDVLTALRYADGQEINHTVDELLARLGFSYSYYRYLENAGGLASVDLRPKQGVFLLNLSTGAVSSVNTVEPPASEPESAPAPKRSSCLFGGR